MWESFMKYLTIRQEQKTNRLMAKQEEQRLKELFKKESNEIKKYNLKISLIKEKNKQSELELAKNKFKNQESLNYSTWKFYKIDSVKTYHRCSGCNSYWTKDYSEIWIRTHCKTGEPQYKTTRTWNERL